MSPEMHRRYLAIDPQEVKTDNGSDLLTFSFSSEEPVERMGFTEVLSHTPAHVDLARLNDGAPLLWNHDPETVIGVVERAVIRDGKGYATVRWGTSIKAQEIRADVSAGVIRNASCGYRIHRAEDVAEALMATEWEPLEISLVSVPADPSVGVGRSLNNANQSNRTEMSDYIRTALPIGEYERATENFSVLRAMQGVASGRLTGLEREVTEEISRHEGRSTQGFFIPDAGWKKRDYVKGTANAGGNLVETSLLEGSFVDALRSRLAIAELGATVLAGNVGDVDIPKRTGSATSFWIGGDGSDSITESIGTLGKISLTPKTVGCFSKFSHLMNLQSTPDIELLIRQDFVALIADAIDQAAISGSGSSNQPLGILNTSGIGSVVGGTNGAAITLDHLLDLKKEVAVDDADAATAGFLVTPQVEAALSKLKDGNSAYHLAPYAGAAGSQQVAGRRMVVSSNVPANGTKGSGTDLSTVIYGNFNDLMIAQWGALEVLVDPYSDFATGTVGVRALQSIDIGVRHAESFAAMTDAVA